MEQQTTVYIVGDGHTKFGHHREPDFPGLITLSFDCAQSLLDALDKQDKINAESCILADITLPDMSGPELQKELKNHGFELPVVFFARAKEWVRCIEAMREGAVNVLEKNCSKTALLDSVCEAIDQHIRLCANRADEKSYLFKLNKLTPRERQIYILIIDTNAHTSSHDISEKLFISSRTVEHHMASIKTKMEAHSLLELINMSRQYDD